MKKETRLAVFEKYHGLCAYTGKPLGADWQVDHVTSKVKHNYNVYMRSDLSDGWLYRLKSDLKKCDDIENLLPAVRIVNHYKRSLDLEGFRHYMSYFHTRLAKLPKKTAVPHTQRRIEYMMKVADLFGITVDKPFCGKFYFETLGA